MTELSDNDQGAPSSSGFAMPPEWAPHEATWLAWPHNRDTWPNHLSQARAEFLQLVIAIAADEPVVVLTEDERQTEAVLSALSTKQTSDLSVECCQVPTNDAWIRDYGPTFVTSDDQLMAVDWQYNAWGGKYPPYDRDQAATSAMIENMPLSLGVRRPIRRYVSKMVLEGGAIEMGENGRVMCTHSCALNENRNAGVSAADIEAEFRSVLGATEVIWLSGDGAIEGDDTDGHIDQLARFVPAPAIVHAWTSERSDSQFGPLHHHRHQLSMQLQALGLSLDLIPLPLPDPVTVAGQRLPASYCNFYVTNGSVLVPQFDRRQDRDALTILAELFTDRQIIGLPSTYLCVGLGSFHCLTQQQPVVGAL